MPTQTFFNLSEEKRERLIAGAMKEFSAKPLNEASISNIVKNSEISRGSFY
ncbi:MAG: TetR/AcrR family transcriptional regulator, partial [Alkalibacterium sp.]|nr:TetR/AcrR family transcriptional regulator [Alkalibacterium sp.]